ncbi:hypothetical protein CBR_g53761 [Chara braunii]|uniref:Peptidase A2 domain-containing protein n=1 Tax=Chara braunii TaxID=69332 RepID=A0A388K6W4_CHABU|nr:hypothetical protein CBR_g53761 [Chara braunii]|eukprot:GBG65792.1 hypothetical protein CBR_g53761 [Chara braunii]
MVHRRMCKSWSKVTVPSSERDISTLKERTESPPSTPVGGKRRRGAENRPPRAPEKKSSDDRSATTHRSSRKRISYKDERPVETIDLRGSDDRHSTPQAEEEEEHDRSTPEKSDGAEDEEGGNEGDDSGPSRGQSQDTDEDDNSDGKSASQSTGEDRSAASEGDDSPSPSRTLRSEGERQARNGSDTEEPVGDRQIVQHVSATGKVGLSDAVRFQRILKYVLHGHHQEVEKVVNAANGSWARFKDGMQRKSRLGDDLLTTADLEAMNRDDFTKVGAFVQEFKKKARKVPGIYEEAQCAIFLRLLTASEVAEMISHGGGSAKLTWATIDKGVEEGSLDQAKAKEERTGCDSFRDPGSEEDWRPGVVTVGSSPRSGMMVRPPTAQGRMTQVARTRGQTKASASQEPPQKEPEPEKRKEAIEVEDAEEEDKQDERLRQEEDQRAEQRAKKREAREEAEPILRNVAPKKKKYVVRLEEGFDVERVIDRLLEDHNDLMTLKEILSSAPKLRDGLKGRLSQRVVPSVHLSSKCAAMVDTGAEMNIIREADALRFGLEISLLNPAENEDVVPESQDDEFEEGKIKKAFRAEEYDGIYLELGLLLLCEMRDRDASERAQKIRDLYLELGPSPVGPDGRPIRLEIGNVEDLIPAFEQFMHDQRILRDEWARTLPLWTRKAERPLARQIRDMARDWESCRAHLRQAFRRPEPPQPKVERWQRSKRQRDPEPREAMLSQGGRKAPARREEESVPLEEERGAYPECGIDPVVFQRFTGVELSRSPQHAREEVAPSRGSLQELEAHLDISQWRESPTSEGCGEPAEEVQQEEAHEPERETRQSAEKQRAMEEVIEVEEDTPPKAHAAELGPEIVREIAREEEEPRQEEISSPPPEEEDTPPKAHAAELGPEIVREIAREEEEPRQEEISSPPPEVIFSQGARMEMERERTDWRREVISTIDRYLAAHEQEHPGIEEPVPMEPPREPHQPEREAGAEISGRADHRTRGTVPAGETYEGKWARVGKRVEEIWRER